MKRLPIALLTFTMLSSSAWAQYPGQPGWGGGNRPDYHADHYRHDHEHEHHEEKHHEEHHHEKEHHEHHHEKHHDEKHHDDHK